MYGENSPCLRPVVLYKGEAPMKEFQPGQAVACDVLTEPEGGYGKATASLENATPIGVIEANRVRADA